MAEKVTYHTVECRAYPSPYVDANGCNCGLRDNFEEAMLRSAHPEPEPAPDSVTIRKRTADEAMTLLSLQVMEARAEIARLKAAPAPPEEPDKLQREAEAALETLPWLAVADAIRRGERIPPEAAGPLRALLERVVRETCEAMVRACEPCGGTGCIPEPGHDCDGDQERCAANCPVEVASRCEYCGRPIMAGLRRWGLSESEEESK